jgi:hypothetical protein
MSEERVIERVMKAERVMWIVWRGSKVGEAGRPLLFPQNAYIYYYED